MYGIDGLLLGIRTESVVTGGSVAMRKDTAQKVMDLLLDFNTDIDKTLLRVKENSTEEEFGKYTKSLANVLGWLPPPSGK